MPVEHTTEPILSAVSGQARKAVSNGVLTIRIAIEGDPANGYPPEDELNRALVELFHAVGYEGWIGSVSKQYLSTATYAPNPAPAETDP